LIVEKVKNKFIIIYFKIISIFNDKLYVHINIFNSVNTYVYIYLISYINT